MLFTIITPCYNSSFTLERTYASLLAQTFKEFEWILIDDCSSDNGITKALIMELASKAPFPVKYFFFEDNNFGSKSLAKGCEMAIGEYTGILDHDDEYVCNTLECAKEYLKKYGKNNIAGVVGRCKDEVGDFMGRRFQNSVTIDYDGAIRYEEGIMDEFVLFSKTIILKEYVHLMRKGYTYGFLWAMISKKYKYIYVNDVFRIYDTALPTSYTNNKETNIRFPEAKVEMNLLVFDAYANYLHHQSLLTLRQASHTVYLMLKFKIKPDFNIIKSWKVKIFLVISFPFACLKYLIK